MITDYPPLSLLLSTHPSPMKLKILKNKEVPLKTEGRMKLSMFACVTSILPDLNDQSKMISGHIVDKEKKVVEKFEFNPQEKSDFDACNTIWEMIKD
uniref:Uncharacterized protein n=1 Tax=Lactuca sativa TaxID=4236 RepID=A0A9R1VC82_LACSA|nr:hypothetical protein LSAT_V11C600338030 [Lactuca sativa]